MAISMCNGIDGPQGWAFRLPGHWLRFWRKIVTPLRTDKDFLFFLSTLPNSLHIPHLPSVRSPILPSGTSTFVALSVSRTVVCIDFI
jgi:hypothetical protein